MRRAARILAFSAAIVTLSGCWPGPGLNADRTAHNALETEIAPATVGTLTEAWRTSVAPPVSEPAVVGNDVYVVGAGCFIVSLDASDGGERWVVPSVGGYCTFDALDPPSTYFPQHNPPFIVDDELYYGAQGWDPDYTAPSYPMPFDVSLALHRGSGERRQVPMPGLITAGIRGQLSVGTTPEVISVQPPVGPPINTGLRDNVYATIGGIGDPPETHRTLRMSAPIGAEHSSRLPTLGRDALFHAGTGTLATAPGDPALGAAARAYSLTEARPGCGTAAVPVECPLWVAPLDAVPSTDPVIAPDQTTVYVGTVAGTVYALDAVTGAVRWTAPVDAAVSATPALAGDVLFVPTVDGRLVALPADGCGTETCTASWEASVGSRIGEQPAVAGGVVFTGADDGSVDAFDAAGCGATTCAALWSAEAGSAITGAPAVTGGQLYIGTSDGAVIAYGLP